VIDPIDGTVNYFFGDAARRRFIALQHREQSVVGVIYDPFTDEIWTTTTGQPTRLNGKIVHVSNRSNWRTPSSPSVLQRQTEPGEEPAAPEPPGPAREKNPDHGLRRAGAVYVASAGLMPNIERTINLWDVAAGSLLVENAGGEFYTRPAPNGKLRMCADNGKLRKKLQVGSLLK